MTQTALLPYLENGDRLSRPEFERRYQRMPQLKKAELIEGVVYMSSPLRYRSHSQPHGMMMGWLGVYVSATPGVEFADNPTIRLDIDNEPNPMQFFASMKTVADNPTSVQMTISLAHPN